MTGLHIDFETRSTVDLKKTGTYVYALDPNTDLWCAAYAFGDEPVELWLPGEPCPERVRAHVESGGALVCHNASFERVVWLCVLSPRHGWPAPQLEQFRCTMAMALAMSLPGALADAAAAVGLDAQKDMTGHRLMLQMARPRRMDGDTPVWWDDETRKQRLYAYCRQDVETERALEKRLVRLDDTEQRTWWLDQRINDRGIAVDAHLCVQAQKVIGATTLRLNAEMRDVTGGEVSACTNVQQLIQWLQKRGVETASVAKAVLTDLLARDDLADDARRALELRREAAKASTAKIETLLRGMNSDGRTRGLLQYHGASTGRWAGRRFQPQNLPRPTFEQDEIELTYEALETGDADFVEALHGPPMTAVSNCIRGMIGAGRRRKLVAADFANIEGRVLAWLAGQADKLDAFRRYDAGAGPDLYKVTAAGIYSITTESVDKAQRQVGKVAELALGFGGGPGAFAQMAKGYGVDVGAAFGTVYDAATGEFRAHAAKAWDERGKRSGMRREAWLAAELIKLAWRVRYKKIADLWGDLERAAVNAIKNPGETFRAGEHVAYKVRGSFLWCRLPSARVLCYPYPRLEAVPTPWGRTRQQIVHKGVNQFTRKWEDTTTYGGKLCVSGNTKVLTDSGWIKIVNVQVSDRLWDGVAWVSHSGVVAQGRKPVVDLAGVRMTPDHLVLTEEGWIDASSCAGHHRARCGVPDSRPVFPQRREEVDMAGPLRVRPQHPHGGDGDGQAAEEGYYGVLRLQEKGNHQRQTHSARYVRAPGVRSVAVDARPLSAADTSGLGELRWSRDSSVPGVGELRQVLVGHGAYVQAGSPDRAREQRRGVFPGELPVGDTRGSSAEPEDEHLCRDAPWPHDGGGRVSGVWRERDDDPLPACGRVAGIESVYDIADAGPRHRFVVQDGSGRPLIVHNCENVTQAAARDVMRDAMFRVEAAGYDVVMTVHDEIVSEVADGFGGTQEFEALMREVPEWATGCPIAVEGWSGERYRK